MTDQEGARGWVLGLAAGAALAMPTEIALPARLELKPVNV